MDLASLRKDLSATKKQQAALDTISELTKIEARQNRVPVRKAEMVPGLCAIVAKPKAESMRTQALRILVDLSVEEDNRVAMAQESKLLSVLVDVLKHIRSVDDTALACGERSKKKGL